MGEFDWPGKRHAKGSRAFGAGGAQKVGVSEDGGRGGVRPQTRVVPHRCRSLGDATVPPTPQRGGGSLDGWMEASKLDRGATAMPKKVN